MKKKYGKRERRNLVAELLKGEVISSQQGLRSRLVQLGVNVNQATLSRDLRDMGIVKAPVPGGGSRYLPPAFTESGDTLMSGVLGAAVRRLAFSGNLMLLFTDPGHAQAVAIALDRLKPAHVLGTIAGDDTVIAVLDEQADRHSFEQEFRKFLDRQAQ